MSGVLLATLVLTGLVLALSALVLAARALLQPAVPVTIEVDGQHLSGTTGRRLLGILTEAGLPVPSACAGAGTCGLCRVHVDGAGAALPTEVALLGRETARAGIRLACQVTVRGPLKVTLPEGAHAAQSFEGKVRSNAFLAPLIREVVIDLPPEAGFDFEAGQFVQVTAPPYSRSFEDIAVPERFAHVWQRLGLHGLRAGTATAVTRAYSIANRPADAGAVVMNIRLALPPPGRPDAPPGVVSSFLFGLNPGDPVALAGPFGDFRAQPGAREMVLIGGGVGMAPLRAIVHDQLDRAGSTRAISFWFGARNRTELFYAEEFEALAARHPNFRWTPALSDPEPGDAWDGPTGFIHEVAHRLYLKDHPAPEDCEYYLCGPPMMIRAVRAMLAGLGVDDDMIFFDDFGA